MGRPNSKEGAVNGIFLFLSKFVDVYCLLLVLFVITRCLTVRRMYISSIKCSKTKRSLHIFPPTRKRYCGLQ